MIDTTATEQAKLGQTPSTPTQPTPAPNGMVFGGQSNPDSPNGTLRDNSGNAIGNVAGGNIYYSPQYAPTKATQSSPDMPQAPIPPPIDTTQPSPKTTNATPYTGSSLTDALSSAGQPSSFADRAAMATKAGMQNYTGTTQQNSQLLSNFKAGFASANASGKAAPQTGAEGRSGVAQYTTQTDTSGNYDPAPATAALATDPNITKYINDFTQSQTSDKQSETLAQTYQDLSKQLGIPGLDTQLMNMKNVINGTQQDIRDEISKAGGFGTESQVQALTNARNKTLIQNYNDLQQTRDDAVKSLDTQMTFTEKDKTFSQQKITDQLNYDKQMIDYADKAQSHAQDVFKTMQASEGWDGIYKAALATGDPQAIAKINSTMGPGFDIQSMAVQDAKDRANRDTITSLDIQGKRQGIIDSGLNAKKTQAEIDALNEKNDEDNGVPNPAKAGKPGFDSTGVKFTPASAEQQVIANWKSSNLFDKNGIIPPANYKQAKAWWAEQGLSNTSFDDVFGQYINTGNKNLYQ